MLKLYGKFGQSEYSFNLEAGDYSIGRDEKADFNINDNIISRRHASISVDSEMIVMQIEDLGSSNGTFVNGNQIESPTKIKPGDTIRFGHLEFYLSINDNRQPGKQSALTNENAQKSIVVSIDEMLRITGNATQDSSKLIKTISEMAKMLIIDESQSTILKKSLKLISQLIPGDRLAILFVSDDREDIEIASTYLRGIKNPGVLNLSKTIINDVIENKSAVLISDPVDDSRYAEAQSIVMSEMKSAMAVPLFDENRVLGILYADTVQPIIRYNNEHLRIMAIFGNIIASRLTNLILLQEREQKQKIEMELQRAAEIQKNLLRSKLPDYDGFKLHAFQEQSLSVGGDLYDAKTLPDGKLLFVLADVSGKGMGAALVMSNILASLRTFYDSDRFELGRVVRLVSLQLFKFTDPETFATMFIGLADGSTGEIEYVNAGHNAPYFIKADRSVEELQPNGVMIGAFDFVEWSNGRIKMASGDQLLIFSDGLPDAQKDNNMYGEERLLNCAVKSAEMSPEKFIDSIMRDIAQFVGNAPQFDDMTVLALKKS